MYPAYYHQWPNAWRRNPHVHYASDVRPEGKYTTKLPFHQLNYHGTEQAQHDPPTPNPLHTPRHTRQMLPVRPALRHLAPPPILPRRPVPLPTATPAPSATPYVHQRAPSAPQAAAPCPPPMSASNAHSVPLANPPPAPPVFGRMPIWSQSRNRWEGDIAYEAQAPSVPTSSSAPPAGAQSAVPPAAIQTTKPPPPVYQQPAQSVHYKAPSAAQPVQISQSAPAPAAQNSSTPLRNPDYAAQTEAPPADAVEGEERSASTVEYITPVLRSDHQAPTLQQPVANQPTTCSAASHANSDVAAASNNTTSQDGHLVLDNSTSHMHAEGVYGLSALLSPWEAIHFLNVTVPVSVNDLQRILRRAHNLRTASFAAITPKTGRLGHEDKIRLPALQRLTIKSIQPSIRGVLKDLVTPKLNYLHVSYAPGSTYYLWSDEQDYYRLFFKLKSARRESSGCIIVSSNDRWYLYHRAAQLQELLQETVGSGWRVTVR
ncbi:hypothetical protein K523DRAFT_381725 [Schizophyllum commune Tattone D]|nr:hypothetical protein K523DRAFT_381725 [Schizophyllum commune Tattone D]